MQTARSILGLVRGGPDPPDRHGRGRRLADRPEPAADVRRVAAVGGLPGRAGIRVLPVRVRRHAAAGWTAVRRRRGGMFLRHQSREGRTAATCWRRPGSSTCSACSAYRCRCRWPIRPRLRPTQRQPARKSRTCGKVAGPFTPAAQADWADRVRRPGRSVSRTSRASSGTTCPTRSRTDCRMSGSSMPRGQSSRLSTGMRGAARNASALRIRPRSSTAVQESRSRTRPRRPRAVRPAVHSRFAPSAAGPAPRGRTRRPTPASR